MAVQRPPFAVDETQHYDDHEVHPSAMTDLDCWGILGVYSIWPHREHIKRADNPNVTGTATEIAIYMRLDKTTDTFSILEYKSTWKMGAGITKTLRWMTAEDAQLEERNVWQNEESWPRNLGRGRCAIAVMRDYMASYTKDYPDCKEYVLERWKAGHSVMVSMEHVHCRLPSRAKHEYDMDIEGLKKIKIEGEIPDIEDKMGAPTLAMIHGIERRPLARYLLNPRTRNTWKEFGP
jgi:hypothetical protein